MPVKRRNDARLWASMVSTLRGAGIVGADAERLARSLVADVRADAGTSAFAPGDKIPHRITVVYDLDGDIWERVSRDTWRMRGFSPADHEAAAGGEYVTDHLLAAYGPLTEITPADAEREKGGPDD
jgi:hypothetical protein